MEQHPSAEVRREVREMLDADRRNESPLRTIVDVVGALDGAGGPGEIPSVIGGYQVTGLLGQGGGGVVLKAVCPKSGGPVAVKVLGIGAWSSRALGRFRQEIKLLGHLSHPGIARILDAGTDRSGVAPHPYFVMEFVDGPTLSAWRRAKSPSTRETVALFAKIVEAVAYSHARGITHRDLKPSNVLVDAAGDPKILDFGVASIASGADPTADPLRALTFTLGLGASADSGRTASLASGGGGLFGTLPYMSPEQISGTLPVDARSDLYSIGVMLFEALAGSLPYAVSTGSISEAAHAIRNEIPTRLGRFDRTLRGDLEVIVSRLLEKRPVDRYQSAQDLLEDLERYLRGQRTRIRRIPMRIRALRFARRYPAYTAAVALLGIVALGSLAYAGYLVAEERSVAARRVESEIESMRVDLSAAALAVARGQPLTSLGALNQVAENRRNWAWQALRRHFNRGSMVSYVFYGPFDLQPRGDRLFVREAASGARTAVYDLRKRTRGTLDLGYNVPLAVSPDGARMVRGFLSDGQLIVTSTEDGATLDAVASPLAEIDAMAWSDDGATLVLANRRGEIGAIDLATGATQRVDTGWTRRDGNAVEVRIADHFVFAAIEGGDAVHAWRLPTLGAPGELRRIPLGDWTVSRLAAARVGGVLRVAVGTEQGAIALLDAERAGAVRRVDFASTPVWVIAIEPRRALLVASCVEGVDRRCGILQAWDLATDEPAGALEARRSVASAAFSADGETLFMGGGFGELKRYSVERDLLAPSIGGAAWRVEHMSLANGGRMVVSTADGAYWWNWDGDRQASRVRPERWPLPSEAIAGRRFAVLSIARDAAGGERQTVLAVADGGAARVRFYAESGAEVGEALIDAPLSADAPMSIAPTERGFVVGTGRRVTTYAASSVSGRVRAELIASTECAGIVRSVSATPDGRALVVGVRDSGDADAQLVGLTASGRGALSQAWQRRLKTAKEGKSEGVAISADGSCAFAVWGSGDMAVYEAALGTNLFVAGDFAPWNIDREADDLCMSPDGRALAVRFADGSVRVIEVGAATAPKERGP